jgi:nicotinate-nucleotide adenylyltransferase
VIGIYGGTFDPIHNGHLHVIKELLQSRRIDRIIVIPAGDPQLRERPHASGKDRLAMCQIAIDQLGSVRERVELSDIEINRNRPSYAIETVEELLRNDPDQEFAWIIGSDAYRKIGDWHESERLQELISFIVIERPANSDSASPASEDDVEILDDFESTDIDALKISATEIRERIKNGLDLSAMVPPAVRSYIESKGLYGSA